MKNKSIKIGIMGFGQIGRYIFSNIMDNPKFQVNIISDIGDPEILQYLFNNEPRSDSNIELIGNYYHYNNSKTRFIKGVSPGEIPWDLLDVDYVIEASGKYLKSSQLSKHIEAGAKKVLLTTLPEGDIDNIIIPGLNDHKMKYDDEIISCGSSTTNAFGLMLKILDDHFGVDYANMTTIHSYTSEQSLQDKVSNGFRRSRSAAENIIPNKNRSAEIIQNILPQFKDKLISSALNVPIQFGSMMDLTAVFKTDNISSDNINEIIEKAEIIYPHLIHSVEDPVVSSDVVGMNETIVFDLQGTINVGKNMVKMLIWYDNGFNHASRMIEIMTHYLELEEN